MTVRLLLCTGTILAMTLATGCGGRQANPVAQYQPGDEERSCNGLRMEIANNEDEMAELIPYEDATGKNVMLGAAGALLIVPFFFMDFKDGEEIELKALKRRNDWLREVAAEKNCDIPPSRLQETDIPCSTAINADKPWIGEWAARSNADLLILDVSQYQVNGRYITQGATYDVDGRVDDQGIVEATIRSSWALADLKGKFPALSARAQGNKDIGSIRTNTDTEFVMCAQQETKEHGETK